MCFRISDFDVLEHGGLDREVNNTIFRIDAHCYVHAGSGVEQWLQFDVDLLASDE